MFAPLEYFLKEGTWSSQDDFVCLQLLTILTCQSHISELLVVLQTSKSRTDVLIEVIPLQTEFYWHHTDINIRQRGLGKGNFAVLRGVATFNTITIKTVSLSLCSDQNILTENYYWPMQWLENTDERWQMLQLVMVPSWLVMPLQNQTIKQAEITMEPNSKEECWKMIWRNSWGLKMRPTIFV